MKKTLVWHQGALGDLVLSLPAIHAIKSDAETEFLHLVSRADLHELLLSNGFIDEASSNDSGLFSVLFGGGRIPERVRDFLVKFNRAFVFSRGADATFLGEVAKWIPRSFHIRTVPAAGEIIHVSDFQLAGLAAAGIRQAAGMPVLDAVARPGHGGPVKGVTVHPGSGGMAKCWSLERYLDCISILAREHPVVMLLGPAEDEKFVRQVSEGMATVGIKADIVRNRSISHISCLLKASSLYIGNDSGITHLASVLGVPTVALFGPTDHRLWKPVGKNTRVVRSGIPCSPCNEKSYRRCGGRKCLETIGVSSVIEEIRALIGTHAGWDCRFPGK